MPRERIYARPRPDEDAARVRVELNWSRDRYLQIATLRLADGLDPIKYRELQYVAEGDRATGVDVFAADGPVPGAPHNAWLGQYMDLERYDVNQLIQHLRRARDQVFGRDQ